MNDHTRVDPDAVLAFGHALTAYLLGGGQSGEGYQSAISQTQAPVRNVTLGASGMREAAYAGSSYAAAADAAEQFISDTCDGLLALTYIAGHVAQTYHEGDAEQADQMATVLEALTPPPGQPTIASQHAQATAAQAAALLATFFGQSGGAPRADQEETRFLNQLDAGYRSAPRATGGSTVDNGRWDTQEPLNDRPDRYIDQVQTHDDVMSGGGEGGSAEDDYDPLDEYRTHVEEARRATELNNIPYEVVVDDDGHSHVEQVDPDDVPDPDPGPPSAFAPSAPDDSIHLGG